MINKKLYLIFSAFIFFFLIGIVSANPLNEQAQTLNTAVAAQVNSIGISIIPNTNLVLVNVSVGNLCKGITQVYLQDSNHVNMSNATVDVFAPNVSVFSQGMNRTLLSGKLYYLVADAEGAAYISCKRDPTTPNTPINRTNIAFNAAWTGTLDESNVLRNIENVTTDSVGVDVLLNGPNNATSISNSLIQFNSTISPHIGINVSNATLFIWYFNGTLYNSTVNTLSGNNSNFTRWNVNISSLGTYKWNVLGCGFIDSVSSCSYNGTNQTFVFGSSASANFYNTTTYETASEGFTSIISTPSGLLISSAILQYNNTAYSATVTNPSTNNYSLTTTVNIGIGTGLVNWFWDVLYSTGARENLSANTQAISLINLSLCDGTNNRLYINYTFKNETTTQEPITASITSTLQYFLGSGTYNKTLTYNSATERNSYAFCFYPQNRTISYTPNIVYANSESPQRTYSPGTLSLSNVTTNKTLYLLPTSLGLYVTFQVVNSASQPLSGALVNVSSTTFGDIEARTTDGSGGATFWLNPLTSYIVSISLSGYESSIQTITPSQSGYTIVLGASSSNAQDDYTKGISTHVLPLAGTLLNGTVYNFNYTISSTYWTLDSFSFYITNGTNGNILLQNSSTTSTGGFISGLLNTGNNGTLVMVYSYRINGTDSNSTIVWNVFDNFGTSWSLSTLFSDVILYTSSGLFGLDSFGLAILAFLIVFVSTGVMSYKYGLTSPVAIMCLLTGIVAVLDIGFRIVPNPVGAIPFFPSIIVALIFITLLLKEVTR